MRRASAIALSLASWLGAGCCVNPFIGTDTDRDPAPGSPERETGGTLAEHTPAMRSGAAAPEESGFDMRFVRVQPGVHIDTEQVCNVGAAGRVEAVDASEEARYGPSAVQRMSIRCEAPTGEGWADLIFGATGLSHTAEVVPGARVRVRIKSAEGGFFDYPIVEFVDIAGAFRVGPDVPRGGGSIPNGFDLRTLANDPSLVGTQQRCVVAHSGDIDVLAPADARRRNYPQGIQNRMTVRCRHAAGEEWADLVFMPAHALAALHIGRGDTVEVSVVSRNGGFFDYPVLQFVGD